MKFLFFRLLPLLFARAVRILRLIAFTLAAGLVLFASNSRHYSNVVLQPQRTGPYDVGASKPGIVEIYQPDGVHTLQNPPADVPPIILKIPEKFRVHSSKGGTRDWGLNLLTYYPGFASPLEPQNAKFGLSCAGFCNGRILVSIENLGRNFKQVDITEQKYYSLIWPNAYALDLLRKKKKELIWTLHHANLHITDFPAGDGFDIVFEELITAMEDAPNIIPRNFKAIRRYYLRWNQDLGYYDLVTECHVPSGNNSFERFSCTLHFSLTCNPAVSVKVTGVDEKFTSEFGNLKTETDKFVSAMLVKPFCNYRE